MTNVVRLIGYTTLPCGCVVGRYRELSVNGELVYLEEKGAACKDEAHRPNRKVKVPA